MKSKVKRLFRLKMHKLPSMPFTSWKSERLNTGCAMETAVNSVGILPHLLQNGRDLENGRTVMFDTKCNVKLLVKHHAHSNNQSPK